MNQYSITLFDVAFIVFILYNQIKIKTINTDSKFTFPLIMIILGMNNFIKYINMSQISLLSWLAIIINFTILAIGMATVRATTLRIWSEQNVIYRQGTWLTILVWIISIGLHAFLNSIGHVGQATTMLYIGITFTSQKIIILKRAELYVNNRD